MFTINASHEDDEVPIVEQRGDVTAQRRLGHGRYLVIVNAVNTVLAFLTLILMGYWSDSVYQLHTRDSKTRFFMYTTIHSFVVLVILVMLNLFGKKKFNPRIVDGVCAVNCLIIAFFLLIGGSLSATKLHDWTDVKVIEYKHYHLQVRNHTNICETQKSSIKCELLAAAVGLALILMIGCIIQTALHCIALYRKHTAK